MQSLWQLLSSAELWIAAASGTALGVGVLVFDLCLGYYLRLIFNDLGNKRKVLYWLTGTIFLKTPIVLAYLVIALKTYRLNALMFCMGFILVSALIPLFIWLHSRRL